MICTPQARLTPCQDQNARSDSLARPDPAFCTWEFGDDFGQGPRICRSVPLKTWQCASMVSGPWGRLTSDDCGQTITGSRGRGKAQRPGEAAMSAAAAWPSTLWRPIVKPSWLVIARFHPGIGPGLAACLYDTAALRSSSGLRR